MQLKLNISKGQSAWNRLLSSILTLDLNDNLTLFSELRDTSGTDLLKANVFGILPKASPTNIQSIFSNKAMMVEANTAVEKEKTQLSVIQWDGQYENHIKTSTNEQNIYVLIKQ